MADREKLLELLKGCVDENVETDDPYDGFDVDYGNIADHLIANGVTIQKWIPASEPPTRKDADKYGRVLAMEMGMMALVNYKGPINYPDRFPYWMPLPQPPKGE